MSSNTPSIAVLVLTKNEERDIATCLQSVQWADERLVIDSGSNDDTVTLAKQSGARVCIHPLNPFNASAQRNWAIEHASVKSDWILFIDADEVVTDALAKTIRDTITNAPITILGYRLAPKFMFMGQWLKRTQHYPAWHDRLFRRGTLRFRGSWPRDEFDLDDESAVGYIEEPYLHYGFNRGFTYWIEKHNIYSDNVSVETLSNRHAPSGKRSAEYWMNNHLILGPIARFLYHWLARGGILDGRAGLIYSLMMFMYQLMVSLKVEEGKRRSAGKPV